MCFLFHKWTKWVDVARGKIREAGTKDEIIGAFIRQERKCERCGKAQIRDAETYY